MDCRLVAGFLAVLCLSFGATRAVDLMFFDAAFVGDLERSARQIVHGVGSAPDQYRYLPNLLVVLLAKFGGFKVAANVCTFVFLAVFLCLLAFVAWQDRPAAERVGLCIFVALIYALSQFAGPRFDTSLYMTLMLLGLCLWQRPLWYGLLIALAAVSRADYALIVALFVLVQAYEHKRPGIVWYGAACLIPIAAQMLLWSIFPEATYYTKVVELRQNLSGEILKMPGFWLTLGAAALALAHVSDARADIAAFARQPRTVLAAKLAILALYVLMVAVVARFREWRLLLPILPLVYATMVGPTSRSIAPPASRS